MRMINLRRHPNIMMNTHLKKLILKKKKKSTILLEHRLNLQNHKIQNNDQIQETLMLNLNKNPSTLQIMIKILWNKNMKS